MPFNGSGTFTRVHNWVTDKNALVKITASRMDAEDDGIATGLSTTICKDGQTTTTAVIPFAAGLRASDGTVTVPSLSFTSDTDCGLYRIGANNVGLALAGVKAVDFSTATASFNCAVSLATALTVGNGGTGVSTTNSVRVVNSTTQVIPTSVDTVITFDTETHDTNSMHSTVSNTGRLTAVVAGTYVISGSVEFETGGSGERNIYIRLNGLTHIAKAGQGGGTTVDITNFTISAVYQLAANDYVELVARHEGGVNRTIFRTANTTPIFGMVRVSA